EVTDLLEALITNDEVIQDILLDLKITPDAVSNVIKWANMQKMLSARYKRYRSKSYFKPKGTMDRAMTAMATPVLDSFSEDLTALAKSGYLPICVAREKEYSEIFNIIQGGRNSVVLVGLPGVGATNIIEGLANRMVAEEVPKILQDKRLVSLSVAHLIAGATHPNELEQKVMIIIKEIVRAGNIILHIENIHDLVGVTSQGTENVDLAEIFSKFLNRKSVITIATTHPQDFKTYLEDSTLGQILQRIEVKEPEDNEAIQMIESKVGALESKNSVYFSYNAIAKAVALSRRYIPDHYLPDKAIHVLEEVVGMVKQEKGKRAMITGEDIAKIISSHTDIPLTEISQEESEKLLNLEDKIHQRMVDQNEAVEFVSSALRRARTELRDTSKPIVNLLFLGPTGVGKTELAKTVSQIYFGSEDKMVRLDMSEYQNKNDLDKLIGRSGESGYLTESIRQKPFSLLLLDEIEKAHPDILNIFLQVMDDGRLTDGKGRTVDFTNCIIIATSNAGTQFIQDNIQAGKNIDEIKEDLINNELKEYYKPEFLNRFDGVVVFKPLSPEDIQKITVLLLNKVVKRLKSKGIYLEITDEAISEIAEAGFDPVFGARPLRRVIQERVDNALANYLLKGKINRRDKVILDKGGELRVNRAKRF
ncbi:ATP-dependent Clp protease ATP-binding subunit, partial [bacterium]|nr:ATP-dependent Clp protease ATP-binding subunit [bacterium]